MKGIPTNKLQLVLAGDVRRISSLLDKLTNAVRPIERRLGSDLFDLCEGHDFDEDEPVVQLNNALTNANILLMELEGVAENLNRERAKAFTLAG